MAKKKPVIEPIAPWDNRWVVPTRDELFVSYKDQTRKLADHLIDGMLDLDGVEEDLRWFGVGWRWSFVYHMPAMASMVDEAANDELDRLAYIVPYPETLTLVVPMRLDIIESMPLRRLNKFVRTGIATSKWAVNVQWATFTPIAQSECDHLLDLLKRKHKYITQTLAGAESAA